MRCHICGSTTTQISEINNFVCTCWNVYNWTLGNKWKDPSQWMIQWTVIRHLKWFKVGSTGDLSQCPLFIVLYWQFPDVVTVTFPILTTIWTHAELSVSPQNTLIYPFISAHANSAQWRWQQSATLPFPCTVYQVCNVFLSIYWCVRSRLSSTSSHGVILPHTLPSEPRLPRACLLTVQGYIIKNDWFLWQKYQTCSINRVPQPVTCVNSALYTLLEAALVIWATGNIWCKNQMLFSG